MARDQKIDELARIEFTGSLSEAFYDYGRVMYVLGTRLRFELEVAASDSEAAMTSLKSTWSLGINARIKARRVAKRLKRAMELADGIAAEGVALHAEYRRQFLGEGR